MIQIAVLRFNLVEVDDKNVYDKDTACQCPCCLDVNIAHQPEDVHKSKVKDTYRHCNGHSRTVEISWYQLYPHGFLFVHLGIFCATCQSDK